MPSDAMIKIQFFLADGSCRTLHVQPGQTLMEAARRADIPGIIAECGGACACATCHVHVAPSWWEKVSDVGADESDMLDFVNGGDDFSRLSCQIMLTPEHDGLKISVGQNG